MNELDVMASLAKAFDELEEDARLRVLGWAVSKYGPSAHTPFQQSIGPDPTAVGSKESAKPNVAAKKS